MTLAARLLRLSLGYLKHGRKNGKASRHQVESTKPLLPTPGKILASKAVTIRVRELPFLDHTLKNVKRCIDASST